MRLLSVFASSLPLPFLAQTAGLYLEPFVGFVGFPSFSSGIAGDECCFHKSVEFAEQDIGQNGTQDRALRNSAERFIQFPLFQVACLQ